LERGKTKMPHPRKTDPRIARVRRDIALARAEIRGPSEPRVSPVGLTSFPIKVEDPETKRMVAEFIARREA
jgi:hypothetical protein